MTQASRKSRAGKAPQAEPPVTERSAGRKLRAKGKVRRDLIMDAAEEIFAERGYYGSSMRDVSARSGASLGILNHYFPSKEQLFFEVVLRKRDILAKIVADSLKRAGGAEGSVSQLIAAFMRPFMRACVDHSSDIRSYVKLTCHFMSTYGVAGVRPALEQLAPVAHLCYRDLQKLTPRLSERDRMIAFYQINAAMVFMVQDTGFLDVLSKGEFTTQAINELVERSAVFFAGGFEALSR